MADLWVAVQAGARRADLAVPAELMVADLAVEAGRRLGATGVLRSVTGRLLDPEAPLGEQAADGDLLLLAVDPAPPRPVRWDDPAEAMAAEVSRRPAWGERDTTRVRLVLGAAAVAVVVVHAWSVLSAAGTTLGALVLGLVAFAVWGQRFLVAVLAPGVLAVVIVLPWGMDISATVVSAVLVLGAGLVPVVSLGGGVPAADVRHVVVALHVAVGAVLVTAAATAEHPLAAAVVGCAATLLALRARRHRDRAERLTSVGAGLAPWLVLAAVALADPSWRPAASVVAVGVAAATFLARPSARVVRMMDVTETVLVLVLPTLVVAWTATWSGAWSGAVR